MCVWFYLYSIAIVYDIASLCSSSPTRSSPSAPSNPTAADSADALLSSLFGADKAMSADTDSDIEGDLAGGGGNFGGDFGDVSSVQGSFFFIF